MRKGKEKSGKLLHNSLKIISSCIKNVSTSASAAVCSAGSSVAASISSSGDDCKEQVLWAGFDKLELSPTFFRHVLLLGYLKGFQIFDVEDASGFSELVSRRTGPVTFLQMLPAPGNFGGAEEYKSSHPILVVVGGEEDENIELLQKIGRGPVRYGSAESSFGSSFRRATTVRFYSMKSNEYVNVIDFRSPVLMVRCSPRVVAIGLEEQMYCFDRLTLEKKFTVVTYPVPRVREQGSVGVDREYGPMAVGPRWLAYPPNSPFLLNTGRVSKKSLAPSVSPSARPSSGALVAQYAAESGKHLAAGLCTLGGMGYKKLSKYYPELLSDSPSSPGWTTGKSAASEPENAGLVTVRDLVSLEVISQFRAHTSPIAALCFDPSGTLLVTASIHGNNINIFRIMPSPRPSGSSTSDWSNSYVYLYNIYRGVTPAVIQDICFSHDSRWIAIVSSKGTCHIFFMSPFGGDDTFQALHSHGQGASLSSASPQAWWTTSTFTINDQSSMPPPPCTLSLVSRIKCSEYGLLNSASNVAASVVGKAWVPSGPVAAIFHNSKCTGSWDAHSSDTSLEKILVYTSSGFVVQHEIQSSVGLEMSGNSIAESWSAPQANTQNEASRIKVEPIQWWDVCRRLDYVEREESVSEGAFDGKDDPEIDGTVLHGKVTAGDKKLVKDDSSKSPERLHWYLSNAELQTNSSRVPVWQKPQIQFHIMETLIEECHSGGETEIERVPYSEVELRYRDLLPIFDHYPQARSGWIEGYIPPERSHVSDSNQDREKTNEASTLCHSDPPSCSSTESSEGGTEKAPGFGLLFKEGYWDKPELHDQPRSTEDVTDEADTGANSQEDDEGWTGGIFDFSEEG